MAGDGDLRTPTMEKLLHEKEQIRVRLNRAAAAAAVSQQAVEEAEGFRAKANETYSAACASYQTLQNARDAASRIVTLRFKGVASLVGALLCVYLMAISVNVGSRIIWLCVLCAPTLWGLHTVHQLRRLHSQPRNLVSLQKIFAIAAANDQKAQARWTKKAGAYPQLVEALQQARANQEYWQRELHRAQVAIDAQVRAEQVAAQHYVQGQRLSNQAPPTRHIPRQS